jgi:concentrative nucleoside transporter, CNT family
MEILIQTARGLLGIAAFIFIAWCFSANRRAIPWRLVLTGMLLQFVFGFLVLRVDAVRAGVDAVGLFFIRILDFNEAGARFLFGNLVDASQSWGFLFAFKVLPSIVFFSALTSLLFYLGILQRLVFVFAWLMSKTMNLSGAESLSASANIFVGQTEAPLVVKPYIPKMTSSELFAVMVGGLASVAGSVLAGYAAMGVEMQYLLAASFMAAPGGLLFAKLIKPETEVPGEAHLDFAEGEERPANLLDAAALGASTGLKLALNVGAMLLAFIGLIALVNLMLGGVGSWFDHDTLSLQQILGWVFAPVAWMIGVPWADATQGGSLIGQKLVLNEFVAYVQFAGWKDAMGPRAQAVSAVALCGFANLSSIAILLGGLGSMAPARRGEIARLGLKAVAAATFSNLTSAAIVGMFVG